MMIKTGVAIVHQKIFAHELKKHNLFLCFISIEYTKKNTSN